MIRPGSGRGERPGARLAAGAIVLALPAAAYANVGVPIAPMVGLGIAYYLPVILLCEVLILRWRLPLSWPRALICALKWNVITTLVGFPLLLVMLFGLFFFCSHLGIAFPPALAVLGHLFWTFPPSLFPERPPHEWFVFLTCATLMWTVIACALSIAIEDWLARREPALAQVSPAAIHKAVLLANLASYTPLLLIMAMDQRG